MSELFSCSCITAGCDCEQIKEMTDLREKVSELDRMLTREEDQRTELLIRMDKIHEIVKWVRRPSIERHANTPIKEWNNANVTHEDVYRKLEVLCNG